MADTTYKDLKRELEVAIVWWEDPENNPRQLSSPILAEANDLLMTPDASENDMKRMIGILKDYLPHVTPSPVAPCEVGLP
jgi:hypothetical protein